MKRIEDMQSLSHQKCNIVNEHLFAPRTTKTSRIVSIQLKISKNCAQIKHNVHNRWITGADYTH